MELQKRKRQFEYNEEFHMKSFKGAELAPEQKFQIGLRIAMNMCTLNRAEEITQLERKKLIM